MPVYADTSFLIALYGNDQFTPAARTTVLIETSSLLLCELNRLEFENALHLLHFRKLVTPRFVNEALTALKRDEKSGLLRATSCDWPAVFARAEQISARRTSKSGQRTMDLLHVAVALTQPVEQFFSFDLRQRALAQQEGLRRNRMA